MLNNGTQIFSIINQQALLHGISVSKNKIAKIYIRGELIFELIYIDIFGRWFSSL